MGGTYKIYVPETKRIIITMDVGMIGNDFVQNPVAEPETKKNSFKIQMILQNRWMLIILR